VSKAYNFNDASIGTLDIKARNLFYLVDDSAKVTTIYAETEAHTARLAAKIPTARPAHQKRAQYNGCSSSEQSQLVAAAAAAQNYAAGAFQYLQSHTSSTSRFTTWFGTYSSSHHSTVLNHFSNLNSNDYSSYTYDCTCNDAGVYAYTFPDEFGVVFLCPVFWQVATTGTDSKGGTLIHESTHFTANAGTEDYVYGQSGCKSLAVSNSNEAINNADSHEYFAENNPAQS
jgi:peptidyl-Lys metalloendopeptidase